MPEPIPSAVTHGTAHDIGPRLDRLPLTGLQWRLVLITQVFWGLIIAVDNIETRLYPYVWQPEGAFSSWQYSLLVGFQVGLGVILGEYLLGFLSDRIGRRRTMMISCLIVSLLFWPSALTSNWAVLMVVYTLGSLGIGGMLATNVVYAIEVTPPDVRSRVLQGGQLVAGLLATIVSTYPALYLIPAHYQLYVFLMCAVPLVVALPLIVFGLPESPRWLESKGRHGEADAIVKRWEDGIRRSGRELAPVPESRPAVPVTGRVPVGEVFHGVYRRRTIVLLIVWILGYGGVDYGLQSYQQVFLTARGFSAHQIFSALLYGGMAGIVIAIGAGAVFSERIERRTWVFIAGVCSVVGAAGYAFGWHWYPLIIVSTALLHASVFIWAFHMYNYTAAAYPTRLRSVGTGWTDGVGHLGAVFGSLAAGGAFNATAHVGYLGWFVYFAVLGALVPGLILLKFGMNQKRAVLETISA